MEELSKKTSRIAGYFYLAHFIAFFIADNGVHYTGVEPLEDVHALLNNMMSSDLKFNIGVFSFVVTAISFFCASWALYVLLKPVSKEIAMLFMLINLGGISVWLSSLSLELAIPFLLRRDMDDQLAPLFLSMYKNGFMISQIFLNLWLFPLGFLVYKSGSGGVLPRILGIFLLLDGFAMLAWAIQFFMFPGYEFISTINLAIGFIAESSFCLWLILS